MAPPLFPARPGHLSRPPRPRGPRTLCHLQLHVTPALRFRLPRRLRGSPCPPTAGESPLRAGNAALGLAGRIARLGKLGPEAALLATSLSLQPV